jgi:glutathione synthase
VRIAVIMDPIETVDVERDTSFALMLEAQTRGHEVFHVEPSDLWAAGGSLCALARSVTPRRARPPDHASIGEPREVDLAEFGAVLVRTDPPFDQTYLQVTQLLELIRGRTLVVNDPRGLRDANEKLYALHFADLMPRTIVTNHARRIGAFVDAVGGCCVIKPLNGAGGRGVMVLDRTDLNFHALIEISTREGGCAAMVQEYVPQVRTGDKRILVLDGEALGAILRVPRADEARSNLHVGGRAQPTSLEPRDLAIVQRLAPKLREDGLFFVGLDVIGGKLTEVNVTSPTGLQELARFTESQPAARVLEWIECRAALVKT